MWEMCLNQAQRQRYSDRERQIQAGRQIQIHKRTNSVRFRHRQKTADRFSQRHMDLGKETEGFRWTRFRKSDRDGQTFIYSHGLMSTVRQVQKHRRTK